MIDDEHGPLLVVPAPLLDLDPGALGSLPAAGPADAAPVPPGRYPIVAWLRAAPPGIPAAPRSPAQAATEEYRHLAPPWSTAVQAVVQVAQRVPVPTFPQDLLDGAVSRLLAPPA